MCCTALVLPALTLLLLGIFGYGQYFLLAHSAQQMANDAARATIARPIPRLVAIATLHDTNIADAHRRQVQ